MARPTKLTPEVAKRICDATSLGVPRDHAAAFAGVSAEVVRQWMRKGEAGVKPYVGFLAAIRAAEGEAVVRLVGNIQEAIVEKRLACKAVTTVNGRCEACGTAYHVVRRCHGSIAVPGSWAAASWILERRHPREFGRSDRVEVTNTLTPENALGLMVELAEKVVREVADEETCSRIAEGWREVARRRGITPSSDAEEAADRAARARIAQAKMPGLPP